MLPQASPIPFQSIKGEETGKKQKHPVFSFPDVEWNSILEVCGHILGAINSLLPSFPTTIFQGQHPLLDSAVLNIDTSHQVANKHFLLLKTATSFQTLITINSISMSGVIIFMLSFIPQLTSKLSRFANSYGPTSFLLIPLSYSSAGRQGLTSEPEQ